MDTDTSGDATLEQSVADLVLAQASVSDADRERTERFAASALAACARYNRETAKLAARQQRFRQEFGAELIASWAADQLGGRPVAAPLGDDATSS
ncbi:hypothetical protein KFE25_010411 [Diacronema lutheri]|uniref:Uncharacterized protein n=1 Tax=Diacronema lutheri TaxID=2081491 RepID=A0A8J5XBU6_DIALT|nr:hypothetical protein KFE25_010411 [Diacronema lutheri]